MSKAERMTQWRHSRQLFDPESEAGLATPPTARSAGAVGGADGTIPDAASRGAPYWTPTPLRADATATRASPGPEGAPTTAPTTPVSDGDIASSLHLALASATNEIDRLTRALETARALRDVAKTRVEEETALRLAAKAREDAAEGARAEAEAAMLAARASAKAHEDECRFLAERAFEAEAQAQTRLAEARAALGARWDEEAAARDSELAACVAREEDASEAYADLVRAVDAERARCASERDARDAEREAERAAWAAERAALVEALEVSFDDAPRGMRSEEARDRGAVEVIKAVTAAVTAERARVFADVALENASARADAAAADALARADAREAERREDALRAALAETRAALEGAEASRAALEAAAARATRDAERAEAEAREAREERDAAAAAAEARVEAAERRARRAEARGELTNGEPF
jgi:SWI/SNF-related matrix-associated actin-dependent regulator 1 of chromatin subfamily A